MNDTCTMPSPVVSPYGPDHLLVDLQVPDAVGFIGSSRLEQVDGRVDVAVGAARDAVQALAGVRRAGA